jgi:uncharacterized delta-60 repeat protein
MRPAIRSLPRPALAVALAWLLAGALVPAPALAADGDRDPAFGADGKVTTPFPIGAYATAVAIQEDQKIVAVGAAAGPSETGEFAVVRYEPDGTLDATFGGDGIVTTAIRGGHFDEARSVAIQPNGRIVVAGTDSGQRFAVVRYRPKGKLDRTFGGDGIVLTNFAPGDDVAWDVALQPDGKIVAVGAAGFGQEGFRLARYRRNGDLDQTFGVNGKVMTRYQGANARAVVIQSDGRIVVAGYNRWGLALARYRPDGRPDRSFNGDGRIGRAVWGVFALAVALQPDGRIVAAGDFDIFHIGLARFTSDGRLDPTFGGDGVVRRRVKGVEQGANGLVIQPTGRIVATGMSGPHEFGDTTPFRFVAIRLRRNGDLDPTWGGDGKVATFFPGGAFAHGAAEQADGNTVVVGGSGEGNNEAFALVRYLA